MPWLTGWFMTGISYLTQLGTCSIPGGGFKYMFIPIWGTWSNLSNIFHIGWNHQLVFHSLSINRSSGAPTGCCLGRSSQRRDPRIGGAMPLRAAFGSGVCRGSCHVPFFIEKLVVNPLAMGSRNNQPHTWMSRWKLGSMMSRWVISPQYTPFLSRL